jgi:hypothetical protein
MSDLVIHVTNEQRQQIEERARQQGFDTPDEYLLSLVKEDADQAYFWSKQWQAGEQQADDDIATGHIKTFDTMDDLISDLMSDDE